MYIFEATYTDMKTGQETVSKIEVDEQFFDNEREIYMYAMGKAYDMQKEHASLDKVVLICF